MSRPAATAAPDCGVREWGVRDAASGEGVLGRALVFLSPGSGVLRHQNQHQHHQHRRFHRGYHLGLHSPPLIVSICIPSHVRTSCQAPTISRSRSRHAPYIIRALGLARYVPPHLHLHCIRIPRSLLVRIYPIALCPPSLSCTTTSCCVSGSSSHRSAFLSFWVLAVVYRLLTMLMLMLTPAYRHTAHY